MEETVEVSFKNWLMAICYTGSLVLFAGGIFNLYNGFQGDFDVLPALLQWFLITTAVISIIVGLLLLVHFRKFHMVFK